MQIFQPYSFWSDPYIGEKKVIRKSSSASSLSIDDIGKHIWDFKKNVYQMVEIEDISDSVSSLSSYTKPDIDECIAWAKNKQYKDYGVFSYAFYGEQDVERIVEKLLEKQVIKSDKNLISERAIVWDFLWDFRENIEDIFLGVNRVDLKDFGIKEIAFYYHNSDIWVSDRPLLEVYFICEDRRVFKIILKTGSQSSASNEGINYKVDLKFCWKEDD
jgi:hypothetical protein